MAPAHRPNGPEECSEGLGPGGWNEYGWPMNCESGPCPGACAIPDTEVMMRHTTPRAESTMRQTIPRTESTMRHITPRAEFPGSVVSE
jgi:hypothetical protein